MRLLFLPILLISLKGMTQWKSYSLSVRGDTINCVDMQDQKQGPWIIHTDPLRGEPGYEEQGYFDNDKRTGRWQKYTLNGDLVAIENYRWGYKDGLSYYYTPYGGLIREESWKAVDPGSPYDTIPVFDLNDPTKIVERRVIKLEGTCFQHGTWTYYDPTTGHVEKTEKYYMGKPGTDLNGELVPLVVKDNNAEPEQQTYEKKDVAKPKEVLEFEKKNSGKKKVKVRDGRTGGG